MLTDEQKREVLEIAEKAVTSCRTYDDPTLMGRYYIIPGEAITTLRAAFAAPEEHPEPETCWCRRWYKSGRRWLFAGVEGLYVDPDRETLIHVYCRTCGFCLTDPARNDREPVAWVAWTRLGKALLFGGGRPHRNQIAMWEAAPGGTRIFASWLDGKGTWEDEPRPWFAPSPTGPARNERDPVVWVAWDADGRAFIHKVCPYRGPKIWEPMNPLRADWLDDKGTWEDEPRPLSFAPPPTDQGRELAEKLLAYFSSDIDPAYQPALAKLQAKARALLAGNPPAPTPDRERLYTRAEVLAQLDEQAERMRREHEQAVTEAREEGYLQGCRESEEMQAEITALKAQQSSPLADSPEVREVLSAWKAIPRLWYAWGPAWNGFFNAFTTLEQATTRLRGYYAPEVVEVVEKALQLVSWWRTNNGHGPYLTTLSELCDALPPKWREGPEPVVVSVKPHDGYDNWSIEWSGFLGWVGEGRDKQKATLWAWQHIHALRKLGIPAVLAQPDAGKGGE